MEKIRYDEHAALYEALLQGPAARRTAAVAGLLLRVLPGWAVDGTHLVNVVDLCCGPGLVPARLAAARDAGGPWWDVTGVDVSMEQLSRASQRLDRVVLASAADTGLDPGYDVVTCTYATTDVDDWPAVVGEAHRLLRPGGVLAVVAAHPAFHGPDAQVVPGAGGVLVPDGSYTRTRYVQDGLGFSQGGLRQKVGAWHHSLTDLLVPVLDQFQLLRLREAAGDPPLLLGFSAART